MSQTSNDLLTSLGGMRSMRLAQMARESAAARDPSVRSGATVPPAPSATRTGDRVDIDFARANSRLAADQLRAGQTARAVANGLSEIGGMLAEVKTIVDNKQSDKQIEVDAILADVDRVAGATSPDGAKLLDGSLVLRNATKTIAVPGVSTEHLGEVPDSDPSYRLKDLKTGGRLASGASGRSAVVNAAITQLNRVQSDVRELAFSADSPAPDPRQARDVTEYARQARDRIISSRGVDLIA